VNREVTIRLRVPTLRELFPTPALAVLLLIGFVDLVSTAVLHHHGLIVELNPLMRPIIEASEWLFAAVKGMTLGLAWLLIAKHYPTNQRFATRACWFGCAAYLFIWCAWFFAAS